MLWDVRNCCGFFLLKYSLSGTYEDIRRHLQRCQATKADLGKTIAYWKPLIILTKVLMINLYDKFSYNFHDGERVLHSFTRNLWVCYPLHVFWVIVVKYEKSIKPNCKGHKRYFFFFNVIDQGLNSPYVLSV